MTSFKPRQSAPEEEVEQAGYYVTQQREKGSESEFVFFSFEWTRLSATTVGEKMKERWFCHAC